MEKDVTRRLSLKLNNRLALKLIRFAGIFLLTLTSFMTARAQTLHYTSGVLDVMSLFKSLRQRPLKRLPQIHRQQRHRRCRLGLCKHSGFWSAVTGSARHGCRGKYVHLQRR